MTDKITDIVIKSIENFTYGYVFTASDFPVDVTKQKSINKVLENLTKAGKIRHFYDLYYLANDKECAKYIQSFDFQIDLQKLFSHDQQEFEEPTGWQTKSIKDSPLVSEFPNLWKTLRETYQNELTPLTFSEIPNEKRIEESFMAMIKKIV